MHQYSNIKILVRGAYSLQTLRIQMGNRIVANFRSKLGLESSAKEEELDVEGKEILKELRASYSKIADGIPKLSPRTFVGDGIVSTYTEFALVAEYFELEETEKEHFVRLGKVLEEIPIFKTFLKEVKGCGPAMSGVIISEIDIHKARHPSSLWKLCFPAGTAINTSMGTKNIETLQVGDKVLSHKGQSTAVLETFQRKYSGSMYEIKARGCFSITATDEHPFLATTNISEPAKWVPAKDLTENHFIVVPSFEDNDGDTILDWKATPKAIGKSQRLGESLRVTNDLARFLGKFVADGYSSLWQEDGYDRGVSSISFGKHAFAEAQEYYDLAEDLFGAGNLVEANTSFNLIFGRHTIAARFREWCGYESQGKRIPDFIMRGSVDIGKAFLCGYFFGGDGHTVKEGKAKGSICSSSASKQLTLQLQLLLTKVGVFAPVHLILRSDECSHIHGRKINQQRERYCLSIPTSEAVRIFGVTGTGSLFGPRRKFHKGSDGWLCQITSIDVSDVISLPVFNVHTESNTYLAQNIAVHNCGVDVAPDGKGRSRRKEHLVKVAYKDKNGKEAERDSITFNPFLKTKLLGVLGGSFLKSKSPYAEIYYNTKTRLENHAVYGLHTTTSKGHRHNMATRKMIKVFLCDLYVAWRTLEGLPVSLPYAQAKLGYPAHGEERNVVNG